MTIVLLSLLSLVFGKPAGDDQSLTAEVVPDLTSASAPAYWSAECGGRTYVGSYTLMMDWADCKDYCTYFPHSVELGHIFSFADITDVDTMECLRFNMNNQYTPSNGYDGHYWAGGYRGGDGQYRWDSGAVFDFDDFVENPGEDPYLHLTPGNNYQWNTKNDRDDRNNGCLCKSQEPAFEVKNENTVCPSGWINVGAKCLLHRDGNYKTWVEAKAYCVHLDAELLAWRTREEYEILRIWFWEMLVEVGHGGWPQRPWSGAYKQNEVWGDWVWGNTTDDWVPMDYGWWSDYP